MRAARNPIELQLYRALSGPVFGGLLLARVLQGKEDKARLGERFGRSARHRPDGPLVWFHGASVGETLAGLILWQALSAQSPALSALFTSGTRTSAEVFMRRGAARAQHQYGPMDTPSATARFLDHWRPDLGVFLESELWPTLIGAAADRGLPLALANARMTSRSLAGWRRRPALARHMLGRFSWIGAADAATAAGLSAILGRPVETMGNVKLAAAPPPLAEAERLSLATALSGREVWVAASTHPGEEEIAMRAHAAVCDRRPGALLILAPRHPERGDEICAMAARRGLVVSRRSRQDPVMQERAVLLWDTIGELALAYAVAPVAFVGGSLAPGIGGHNPVEPAQLGAAILSGPEVFNFSDTFGALFQSGGALSVTAETLGALVVALFEDPEKRARMTAAARSAAADGGGALSTTVTRLLALLEPL